MQREIPTLVGSGPEIARLKREIERVAPSDAKVLITGPTGAGKELVAREIHRQSRRYRQPLVIVNCAGLHESLLETELFGHTRGSFTGALRDHRGRLAEANGGTLFLDEIGDMTLRMQGLILRFLESGELQPVGKSTREIVDVRVITATNADIPTMMAEKMFRKDLYFRLKVIHIETPALQDRPADIPELIAYFTRSLNGNNGHPPTTFTADALDALKRYKWPGNVRELRNTVENLLLYGKEQVTIADLPQEVRASVTISIEPHPTHRNVPERVNGVGPIVFLEEKGDEWPTIFEMRSVVDKQYLSATLQITGGNISRAADKAGLARSHLYKRMKAVGLEHLAQKAGRPRGV